MIQHAQITIKKDKQLISRDIVFGPDTERNIKRVLGKQKDITGWSIKTVTILKEKLGL